MPLKGFNGGASGRSGEIGPHQHEIERRITGGPRSERQRSYGASFQSAANEMFRQPCVGKTRFNRSERSLQAAYRAPKVGPQPPFVSRMLHSRVPYDYLNLAHEVCGHQCMIDIK